MPCDRHIFNHTKAPQLGNICREILQVQRRRGSVTGDGGDGGDDDGKEKGKGNSNGKDEMLRECYIGEKSGKEESEIEDGEEKIKLVDKIGVNKRGCFPFQRLSEMTPSKHIHTYTNRLWLKSDGRTCR